MAVSIIVPFLPVQLAGSVAVIYTVPAAPTTTVFSGGRVRLANTDTAAHACTLYAVPASGSPAASNEILPGESVAANAHVDVDVPLMGPGATLQGFADTAAKVTVTPLSGVLFS